MRNPVGRIGDTWTFSLDDKTDVIDNIREYFLVYEKKGDEDQVPSAEGTRQWLLCQSKMDHLELYGESRTADSIPIISPLIETLLTNKHSLSDLDVLKIRAEYKLEYVTNRRKFQEDMVHEFCERVWDDEEADISGPGRSIILWKKYTRNKEQTNFQFEKLDKNMSVFANRAIRIMDFYDRRLFVSAAHKRCFFYSTQNTMHTVQKQIFILIRFILVKVQRQNRFYLKRWRNNLFWER